MHHGSIISNYSLIRKYDQQSFENDSCFQCICSGVIAIRLFLHRQRAFSDWINFECINTVLGLPISRFISQKNKYEKH